MPQITIAGASTALNQFCTQFSPKIAQTLKQGLEFERDFDFVPTEHTYVTPSVSVSNVLQPYQYQFTPNNDATFTAEQFTLKPGKVDLKFTQEELEKFYDKWACKWFDLGQSMMEKNPFSEYMISNHIMPQLMEDWNMASWAGVRVEPTAGTAGTYLQSWNGYKKVITDLITAGKVVPIATGAPSSGAMVDWVRSFCYGMPELYRTAAGKIYMSATNAARYSEDYMEKYPRAQEVVQNPNAPVVRVDHFNKMVVGVNAMAGSNRIFFCPDSTNNEIIGTKINKPVYPVFRFQEQDRVLKVLSEAWRFYGFEFPGHLYVNDQA